MDSYYTTFIQGFWDDIKIDDDGDTINTILYIDSNSGKLIISKNDNILTEIDFNVKYTLNTLHRNYGTYDIIFTVDDNYSKYAKILTENNLKLDIFISEGYLIIYDEDIIILEVFKNNKLNNDMTSYLLE
jgi:hypothetical protein